MDKTKLKLAIRGQPGLLVISISSEFSASGNDTEALCMPLMTRQGGLLLAVPFAAFDQQALLDGLTDEDTGMIGPNKMMESDLLAEDEEGSVVSLGRKCKYYVVDFSDDILLALRDYDQNLDEMRYLLAFDSEENYALPDLSGVIDRIREWASTENMGPRAAFYSAREEPEPATANGGPPKKPAAKRVSTAALMERVEALAAQVQLLQSPVQPILPPAVTPAEEQSVGLLLATPKMPRLSDALGKAQGIPAMAKAAALLSPPPRQRSGVPKPSPMAVPAKAMQEDEPYTTYDQPQDFMMQTLNQQSSALTALVAHLTTGGEGLLDIGSSSSSSATGTRGLQRRERLISELAGGSSTFFLQFQQQLYRKMNPSVPAPKTEEEIQRNPPSLLNYLERNGGFRTQRTLGLVLWMLAYAVDAGARGDDHMMKEHLVLAVTAIEQCAVDSGEWGLGFLLSLAADPPVHLFQDRSNTVSMQHRTFGGLVPPAWSTVAVAYLREMEVLNSKKQDLSKKAKAVDDEEENPSPRRRPRFPRRPKAKAKAEA